MGKINVFQHEETFHTFSLTEVYKLVRFVIKNTFLSNGGDVRQQVIGLPMGTNSAHPSPIYTCTVMNPNGLINWNVRI